MPQAISVFASPHEGKKRRGYDSTLAPRPSSPTALPMAARERLPPISSLLPNLPPSSERVYSQNRVPVGRENASGPRSALPARLSPPPATRRTHLQSCSESSNGGSSRLNDRSSSSSCYDGPSNYQLPIHAGPRSRTACSSTALAPPPVSPYSTHQIDTRRGYANGDSHSVPPPAPYHQSPGGRTPPSPYHTSRDYCNGDASYRAPYPTDARNRDYRNGDHRNGGTSNGPSYQPPHSDYRPPQYGYQPPPPPASNGHYPIHHHYQNGYHHGSVQFEGDEHGGQAPRRRRGNLPRDTTDLLKQWFQDHLGHPYPTEDEKQFLCRQTGLQMTQISNWFINARRRRIPELVNQAHAETVLRENSGDSNGSSD